MFEKMVGGILMEALSAPRSESKMNRKYLSPDIMGQKKRYIGFPLSIRLWLTQASGRLDN